jgi:hypothetical protein
MGFHIEISQTSPDIHPKPKTSFCDHLLVHNPIWVWRKILDGDSNIPQDYGIYAYFSNHPPSFMLEDEHRSSMGEESLHHLWQMLCKYYVAKVLRSKRKQWKMKKIDEKKRKIRKKEEERKNRKREKWEGNKIKVKKRIIKLLLGSFCFISSQVPWWQIHTQIFQPCAIP